MMISNLFTNFAATCPSKGEFLGLRPWYYYINDDKHFGVTDAQGVVHKCDFQANGFHLLPGGGYGSDVPLVLLAVVDDLLRIAGLVAVAFIIVGAVRFITSQGNADEAAQARGTVINALIGLVICLVAIAFVSFLGNKL